MESPLLSTNPDLKWALHDYESRSGTQSRHVEFLPGTGNQSYRVDFADESLVLRLNGDSERLGVDRATEKQVLAAISNSGIGAQTRLWQERYLVVDFVANHGQATAVSVAAAMGKLHQLPVPPGPINFTDTPAWTPAQTVRDYLAQSTDVEPLFSDHLGFLEACNWSSMTQAICHCDLNPNNILQPTAGGAVFIDWEYARVGPTAYDIAVYAQTHHLDVVELNEFLDHYPGAPAIESIAVCNFAYKVIEVLWLSLYEPPKWPIEKLRPIAERLTAERLALTKSGPRHE
ncbi:MAG: thiamine kinase-like enzyme [Candidatus Azotimanducaceae bacterium]|jgi:thiamine kinase-like enzyme